jgi:MFS transporter, CP family, cyanate transporter
MNGSRAAGCLPRTQHYALLVVLGGVSAALHIGKLPVALPALRDALGVTLVQAGFLLSLVQFAGMALGLAVGLAADPLGLKRTTIAGLLVVSGASLAGGFAQSPGMLMLLRAMEGFGVLLAAMPAPGLMRRLVEPGRINSALGWWGAYMPLGTAIALVCGPVVIAYAGWRVWWWLLAMPSAAMAAWLWLRLPADPARQRSAGATTNGAWPGRLRSTLRARGPWLIALIFAAYSAQWLAVIGFLPTVYGQAGISATVAGAATALAALVNMVGNIASGKLLQAGARAQHLLYAGCIAMALGALVAFAPLWSATGGWVEAGIRYAAVLMFSMVGGLIPGTLFSLAVELAPDDGTVSTTVGWMQQWSSFGQFAGPPLVAWVASRAGGWQWSWVVTGACALAAMVLARSAGAALRARTAARSASAT